MIQISVSGGDIAQAAVLAKVADVLENDAPLLDEAGAFLFNRIRTRFLAERDPYEIPWEPSKAAIERRKHGGSGTLFDTGRLFHSIQLATVGEKRIIGTDVDYGKFHQWGVPGRLPQRMFIGFNPVEDVDILQRLLEQRLGDLIQKVLPRT